MTTTTTRERLLAYIHNELLKGRDVEVAPDDDLLLSGLVDSVGVMSLLLFIETELGVEVPPQDVTIDHFTSVAAIEDYLASRMNGGRHD